MSDKTAEYMKKAKRATKILFYKRHRQPGVKGWELKRALGSDYIKIVDIVNRQLENLDLQVNVVYESPEAPKNPTEEQLEKARFYITLREPLQSSDMTMSGWRIDDIAVLVVAVSFIISKQGKSTRKEVEQILREKFPKRRIDFSLNRFIRMGYLSQDEANVLYLDWRARAEIDQKTLLKLIIGEAITKT
ncbi:MAG: hypothetical protein V1850_04380 [Candidatus Bathyarchaeota archaeon]